MNIVSTLRRSRLTAAATTVAVLALALAACGSDDSGAGGTEDKAKAAGITLVKPGKFTVCTHLPYKPFQYKDGNKVVGFDVDLLDLVAQDLGLEQEVVNIEWAQVTSGAAFKAKKCDMGMGAMTITPERQAAISITDPYMDATQVLMAKKDSGIKGLEDLRGKNLGSQADTTGHKYADENKDKYGYKVIPFPDSALQENNVKSGRVAAAINDNGLLYDFIKDNPDMAVVAEFDTGEHYGFAALKDGSGPKLVEKFNGLLTTAKSDGKYNEIYKKWFGVEPKK
ncbi:ABC transporter substrate-binding protein [Kribbella sp. NPDC050281]|uniref:ABC transporter substrate-binding protein n=1 Tax=Kribbella sp. NPDC050281 TaxID=3155515 RepID=UPI0033F39B44